MIRGVLFDMDGLLLDTERLGMRIMPDVCARMGYSMPPALYIRLLGLTSREGRHVLEEALDEGFPYEAMMDAFHEAFAQMAQRGEVPAKKGLEACMTGLKARGIRRALATSTHRSLVELYLQSVAPLRDALDFVVCGPEVPNGKPAPDIYLRAAEGLGLAPGECLGVEDSLNGLKSLKAAHVTAVMIPDLMPPDERFRGLVDYRLDDLNQLCGLIDRLNLGARARA